MARSISRSPSYRRRHSPSPVGRRSSRRSRRDRSRSPYSNSHSSVELNLKDAKFTFIAEEEVARAPHVAEEVALHLIGGAGQDPRRPGATEGREVLADPCPHHPSPPILALPLLNARMLQHEAELKLLEEETAQRLEEAIRKNVEERLKSEEVNTEIARRIEEGRAKLLADVAAQLEKEKGAALMEARRKEEQARREREELDRMLEENRRRVEESQRREAQEAARKEEERQRELELIQRQKEEAARRKRLEEEEERAKQRSLLVKNQSRSKMSFGL
ncbi:hypothetical protein CDL15_Pgr013887 [Punica granatum]|uniref:Arginine and glutamate-rich protein 1 n=1 Tax=Punica granatum TaxID=22663 RepID=A0A218W9U4_PUNGR|nr:hypothetical protein CDL15_Pgr013887 [Punica granatum]